MGHVPPPAEVSHPVYATRVLCEVANERGVPTRDVLAGTAIEPADLDKPDSDGQRARRDRGGAPAAGPVAG